MNLLLVLEGPDDLFQLLPAWVVEILAINLRHGRQRAASQAVRGFKSHALMAVSLARIEAEHPRAAKAFRTPREHDRRWRCRPESNDVRGARVGMAARGKAKLTERWS